MILVEGSNSLSVELKQVPTFDPWVYDMNNNCYIELAEWVEAVDDWGAGLITEAQRKQVDDLYQYKTRNPSCTNGNGITDYLNMTKNELYPYLVDGSVSVDWWDLSKTDRRALGLKIIQWWSVEWLGQSGGRAKGGADCSQVPQFKPWEEPDQCIVVNPGMEFESALRYCLFTDNTKAPRNVYWYRQIDDKWYCHDEDVSFGLPTAVAIGGADFLNCLQIGEDVSRLDSWIFFQTWLKDGYPGCDGRLWPSASGGIAIKEVRGITDRGMIDLDDLVTEIYY